MFSSYPPSPLIKYGFRIRTRQGLVVENLNIQGRDEADAERKLRQMYRDCEILDCTLAAGLAGLARLARLATDIRKAEPLRFEDGVALPTK